MITGGSGNLSDTVLKVRKESPADDIERMLEGKGFGMDVEDRLESFLESGKKMMDEKDYIKDAGKKLAPHLRSSAFHLSGSRTLQSTLTGLDYDGTGQSVMDGLVADLSKVANFVFQCFAVKSRQKMIGLNNYCADFMRMFGEDREIDPGLRPKELYERVAKFTDVICNVGSTETSEMSFGMKSKEAVNKEMIQQRIDEIVQNNVMKNIPERLLKRRTMPQLQMMR